MTDGPVGAASILQAVVRDLARYWPTILIAGAILSVGPTLASRLLTPWYALRDAPAWQETAVVWLWIGARTAFDALLACVIVSAILLRERWPSARLAVAALAAFTPTFIVAVALRVPGWAFNFAWDWLLTIAAAAPTALRLLALSVTEFLLSTALQVLVVVIAGLATAAAITAPKEGAVAAILSGYRAAQGWRWTILKTTVIVIAAQGAFALVLVGLVNRWAPVYWPAAAALDRLIWYVLTPIALAHIFLRSTRRDVTGAAPV